jgi:hypothetical protein
MGKKMAVLGSTAIFLWCTSDSRAHQTDPIKVLNGRCFFLHAVVAPGSMLTK